MQAISKGLEKVVEELTASENDGPVSETFCKVLYDAHELHVLTEYRNSSCIYLLLLFCNCTLESEAHTCQIL